MNKSDSIASLADALCKAQAELKSAPFNKKNPFLNNRPYADLGSHIEAAKPILAKQGLSVSQLVTSDEDGRVGVETMLMHKSGEWISTIVTIAPESEKGKSFAQVAGSIISYFRRYSLAGILGMYSDEEDDGAPNSGPTNGNGHAPANVQRPPTQTTANPPVSAPAAAPAADNDELAPANFAGFTKWSELRAQAQGMSIQVDTVLEPGKVTKGQVRAEYAALKARIDAELQTA
jgi:hypothetical protein